MHGSVPVARQPFHLTELLAQYFADLRYLVGKSDRREGRVELYRAVLS